VVNKGYEEEKKELFVKEATENNLMQLKYLLSKMKSSYGKIVYLANKIQSLLHTLWYLLTLHFGLRGCQEHHEMFVEDFSLNKDDQGTVCDIRRKPKNPVQFFKTYLAHRPEEMQNSGPFYLAIIEKTEIRSVVQETEDGCQ